MLQLAADRLTQREIADQLFISYNTVKSHLKTTYRKLGATSRDDALARSAELKGSQPSPGDDQVALQLSADRTILPPGSLGDAWWGSGPGAWEESELPGAAYCFVAPGDAELAQDAADVAADGVHRDEHRRGDLLGREQLGQVAEHLALLGGQRVHDGEPGRGGRVTRAAVAGGWRTARSGARWPWPRAIGS